MSSPDNRGPLGRPLLGVPSPPAETDGEVDALPPMPDPSAYDGFRFFLRPASGERDGDWILCLDARSEDWPTRCQGVTDRADGSFIGGGCCLPFAVADLYEEVPAADLQTRYPIYAALAGPPAPRFDSPPAHERESVPPEMDPAYRLGPSGWYDLADPRDSDRYDYDREVEESLRRVR